MSEEIPEFSDSIRVLMSPDRLTPVDYNPNEMKPEEYERLKNNIKEAGFVDPIIAIARETDDMFEIIGGEHRWRVAKDLGMKEVPVEIPQRDYWKNEDHRKFQNLRLNVIHGSMNPEKMAKLYGEMADKFGKEKIAGLMGYSSDAPLKKMIKNVSKEIRATLPPEVAQQFEEQAKEVRTIGDLQKIIQHLFQEYGDSVKYSFMIFAWGGKEHVYIAASNDVHDALKKIMAKSRRLNVDINDLIGDAIKDVAASLDSK